ncbi:MAG: hypothetical protein KIT09_14770 [Bryobacteraceae bacterium]|nr:hypothetical protein [Bryobacteraceae bacterium]
MVLQVMVIYAMTRAEPGKFAGVFFYLLVLFLTGVADMSMFLELGNWPVWYRKYFFINDTLRHFAGMAAVLSLIYIATKEHHGGPAFRIKTFAATFSGIAGVFVFTRGETAALYMNEVGRNLSFAATVLTAILWFSLVRAGLGDNRLLMVSGGMGLNMAGNAIGESLLRVSRSAPSLVLLGNLIAVLSHLACLLVWWKAFRQPAGQAAARSAREPG